MESQINNRVMLKKESCFNTLSFSERLNLFATTCSSSMARFLQEKIGDSELSKLAPFNDKYLLGLWSKHNNITFNELGLLESNTWLSSLPLPVVTFSSYIEFEAEHPSLKGRELSQLEFLRNEVNGFLLSLESNIQRGVTSPKTFEINELLAVFLPVVLEKIATVCTNVVDLMKCELPELTNSQGQFREFIFNKFPALFGQVTRILDNSSQLISEFAFRLESDVEIICSKFFESDEVFSIVGISDCFGDTHDLGRFTFICEFSNGKKLAYKPRDLKLEQQFYLFLQKLTEVKGFPKFFRPQFLVCNSYGWMEYVEHQPCEGLSEISLYYYNAGCLLSVLYLLEAEDIHYENVVARNDSPVIIDLETLFHQKDDCVISEKEDLCKHTVLKTHFIPLNHSTDIEKCIAPIMSMPSGKVLDRDCIPSIGGLKIPVNDYGEEFVAGFTFGYQKLAESKEWLKEQILNFEGMTARYVARPTAIYSKLLKVSNQAYYQQSAFKLETCYEKLWIDVKKRSHLVKLIDIEKRSLWQLDIPLFTNKVGSKDLISGASTTKEYFQCDSLTLSLRKLQNLSSADCVAQIKLIKRSLTLGEENKPSIIQGKLSNVTGASSDDWLIHSETIAKLIYEQASISNKLYFWPVYKQNSNGISCLDGTNFSLYDGSLGIILSLAYVNRFVPQTLEIGRLQQAASTVLDLLTYENFREDGCGAFNGLGGIVYTISHLFHLWGDGELLKLGTQFISKMNQLVDGDTQYDVMAGSAGAILGLLSYYQISKESAALQLAIRFGSHLVQSAVETNTEYGWPTYKNKPITGFAHGNSGIAFSLLQLYQHTKYEAFRDAAIKAIRYEKSTYCHDIANWLDLRFCSVSQQKQEAMTAWCNGAMGIGYSYLKLLNLGIPEVNTLIFDDIERAKNTTLIQSELNSHNLCHGHFGNQEFIHQLIENGLTNPEEQHSFVFSIKQYLSQINQQGLLANKSRFESLGLMTGLSGVCFQLLKFSLPGKVPSILMLDPPSGN